ncbi:hypothetical protein BBJ28_00007931 [Nothophytophthora sp. Chile5]|nr:hypothetical protein BBJ28_00007931 [Nothophytophthora sp. Chile5]
MAPRFQFRASKFRNVECHREQSFDQLQVSTSPVDGNLLATSASSFAFPHRTDGSIHVKLLAATGKEPPATPPLIRAHPTGRVTALAFSPFHADLLLSAGGADADVKLWRLPSQPLTEDLVTPVASFRHEMAAVVAGIAPHPAAEAVVASYSRLGPLHVYDVAAEQLSYEVSMPQETTVSAAAWSWDGGVMAVVTQDQAVRLLDPRVAAGGTATSPALAAAHTGKRHGNVAWCGRSGHFVTCGSDRMQERELKLWDPRQLAKCVHRERMDAGGVGQLFPLYDADLDLLYVMGKGDRSVRLFEVDLARAPFVHALDHSVLGSMTLAAALLPKQACDTSTCEVARVLNLSTSGTTVGGSCEIVSYRVPRKEATHSFQSDLYPDTLASKAAMSAEEWRQGGNAEPTLQPVKQTVKADEDVSGSVFGRPVVAPAASPWAAAPPSSSGAASTSAWGTSGWGQTLSSTASSNAPSTVAPEAKSGWGSSTRKWNEPEPKPPVDTPQPAQWKASAPVSPPAPSSATLAPVGETLTPASAAPMPVPAPSVSGPKTVADVVELSDKAQRLGAKYGHKLKYLQGKEAPRNDVFHFGDKRVTFSTQASPIIAANSTFWAAPVAGAGGPVLVEALGATGKAQNGAAPVLNGQKAEVTTLAFNPFDDSLLATGSADATIQLWSLAAHSPTGSFNAPTQPEMTLSGHTKGLRALQFHPTAANVLCSTSHDLSLRFWDLEVGQERLHLDGKLDDVVWNMAFNEDGSLLATASRAKIVRVFDPRQHEHALVAMGCGHESSKPQFVTWADATRLLTIGINARNETLVSFWDARSLLEPLGEPVVVQSAASAASTTTPFPLYDASSRLLFLVSTGTRHIWSYEVDPVAATAQANLPFLLTGNDTIGGVALLPKSICDVRNVELDRLLVATPNVLERVSFSLPRAQKLKEFFQDDVYGLVPKPLPVVSSAQWFAGESAAPVFESLRPSDMAPLSEKPKDVAPMRPKTLDFQAQLREEEAKERQKAAQFERLSVSRPAATILHGRLFWKV